MSPKTRLGDEERRLMHLVPAPAVRLMKRRVLSRPGVNSLMVLIFHTPGLLSSFQARARKEEPLERERERLAPHFGIACLLLGANLFLAFSF